MYALTLFYTVFVYAVIAIFIVGFMARNLKYATRPAPLKIALKPAPLKIALKPASIGRAGVLVRIFKEAGLFKSLYYSNKIIWLSGYLMHIALAFTLVKHFLNQLRQQSIGLQRLSFMSDSFFSQRYRSCL